MRGGNLGSSPSDIGCTTAGAKNAAAPVAATAMPAAAPVTTTTTMTTSTAVAADNSVANTTVRAPMRMARAPRADRN